MDTWNISVNWSKTNMITLVLHIVFFSNQTCVDLGSSREVGRAILWQADHGLTLNVNLIAL